MISHPKPRAEPVTMATLPSSFIVKTIWMQYKCTRIYNAVRQAIASSDIVCIELEALTSS
jgi:hypothetical protein